MATAAQNRKKRYESEVGSGNRSATVSEMKELLKNKDLPEDTRARIEKSLAAKRKK